MMFIVAILRQDSFSEGNADPLAHSSDFHKPNFAHMAVSSLLLTVANVVMVAIGATLMFRIKEVLPVQKKVFWDDLQIAPRIYQV